MVYKLCYVDNNEAWFTSNWKEQWGDDWDDRPYEHNAGSPYNSYFKDGVEYPIQLKKVYFDVPYGIVKTPDYGFSNSPFSVKDINSKRCPWLIIDDTYIFAGTSYTDFVRQIEKLNGTIYVPKKRGVR